MGNHWSVFYNPAKKVALLFEMSMRQWDDELRYYALESAEFIKGLYREKEKIYEEIDFYAEPSRLFYSQPVEKLLKTTGKRSALDIAEEILCISKMKELLDDVFYSGGKGEPLAFWVSAGWHFYFKDSGWKMYVKWIDEREALKKFIEKKEKEGWRVFLFERTGVEREVRLREKHEFDIGEAERRIAKSVEAEEE